MRTHNTLMASTILAASIATQPRAIAGAPRADANPQASIAALHTAFAEFKAANDERLKAKVDDVLLDEKVGRIDASITAVNDAINAMNIQLAATQMNAGANGQKPKTPEQLAYAEDFNAHFRNGAINAALSVGSNPDGGYTAPIEWDRTITDALKLVSPLRRLASVQSITGRGYTKLFNDRNIGSGWVGETAARPQTTTPGLTALEWGVGEIYANPAATQQILDDSEINIEAWLASEVETEFARQEGIAFLTGTGVNKPHGLLTYVTGGANAARHPWGAITSVATAGIGSVSADDLIKLIYDLPGELTGNARFAMNRNTQSALRTLKDGNGNYLWQPTFVAGQPSTIAGYPVEEMSDLANVANSAVPVLFGDFRRTYLIIDRMGIRVLRDPYTTKPYVMFYTTKRVGGGVADPTAMRALTVRAI